MATHVIFTAKINGRTGVCIAHLGAGTWHVFTSPQEQKDVTYVLRKSGEKLVTWGSLNTSKSNNVDNPNAFGVRI